MGRQFYITTAIDYTNAPPHIGHAYEKVLADVIARYQRAKAAKDGAGVYFLTGVDQHGQKVQQAAQREGVEPGVFADGIAAKFKALWQKLDVKPDGWASTTDPRHKQCVQAILQKLHDKPGDPPDLYKATHRGFYSVRQEQFLTDKERGADGTFGPEWGEIVEIEEENWYFRLSKYREWLISFVRNHEGFVIPKFRHAELLNAVEKLSGDLCISRPKTRLSWGIELSFDREFVTYVWFDALINYISFAGYVGDASLPDFDQLWPADAHVIGKDILVPAHGIYWPVMLHALGFADEEIPTLLVHGWWNIAGAKMSKSAGNVIDPSALADKYGADALRYYLVRDISTGQDSDFSEERLRALYHSELANGLGNLLNRTLSMVHRYRQGVVTRTAAAGGITWGEKESATYTEAMDAYRIDEALEVVRDFVSRCNGYIEANAPWKLAKDPDEAEKLDGVLCDLLDGLRTVALCLSPVMPGAGESILRQLGYLTPEDRCALEGIPGAHSAAYPDLPATHKVGEASVLFPRIDS